MATACCEGWKFLEAPGAALDAESTVGFQYIRPVAATTAGPSCWRSIPFCEVVPELLRETKVPRLHKKPNDRKK